MTFIFHKYKPFTYNKNVLCLWFVSFIKWDLLAQLEKWVKMYTELKQDYKIVNDLVNNQVGNGYQKRSSKRKS